MRDVVERQRDPPAGHALRPECDRPHYVEARRQRDPPAGHALRPVDTAALGFLGPCQRDPPAGHALFVIQLVPTDRYPEEFDPVGDAAFTTTADNDALAGPSVVLGAATPRPDAA